MKSKKNAIHAKNETTIAAFSIKHLHLKPSMDFQHNQSDTPDRSSSKELSIELFESLLPLSQTYLMQLIFFQNDGAYLISNVLS